MGVSLSATAVNSAAPWIGLGAVAADCRESDDALDAVICSLVARAQALGLGPSAGAADRDRTAREGWIVLPECAPERLRSEPAGQSCGSRRRLVATARVRLTDAYR
ncbi:MAG: hypothetical protein QG615_1632 [Nitrospirota bacterium]|jgi:predicted RNase H-like nuclease|nr:hypothetical protein [Nitrospirota bacterium]